MMTNHYRMHRCRSLRRWAIIGTLCIGALYAGCADSSDTVTVEHTKLAIDNLRVDNITDDLVTVAFTINQPAIIFWTLYAYNAPTPDDIDAVISDAYSSFSDPMIVRNGVRRERSDGGTHTIQFANLPSAQSYNLYVAAVGIDGEGDLADALPITIIRNISDIDITRIHKKAVQINWTNPSARASEVLDKIVIDWNATNRDGESAASGSYSATDILAADAKTHAILPIISTQVFNYQFSFTALYRDGSNLPPVTMNYHAIIDDDGDGLIDIYTLEALNDIRCNPNGAAYQEVGPDGVTCLDFGIACGIDGTTDCTGYELRADLDFSEQSSYATGKVNLNWQANATSSNRGWLPIESLTATFEGNGHTIENLYVRDTTGRSYQLSGLFGRISGSAASIRNVTLNATRVYGGDGDYSHVGALAGELSGGTIENVAVIGGRVDGAGGSRNKIGGLIGQNADKGIVRNSYATATVYGGKGGEDYVGGLVGQSKGSTITASYATGDVHGKGGNFNGVGGLVGGNTYSSAIIASYATGNAYGGGGHYELVGGLVGSNHISAIIASYATGNADGDGGIKNYVGGLAGYDTDSTTVASYATGNADGGGGGDDHVGGLIGYSYFGTTITASYATGNAINGAHNNANVLIGFKYRWEYRREDLIIKDSYGFGSGGRIYGSPLLPGVSRASHLTAPVASNPPNTAVPQTWDSAAASSKGAWDFGTNAQLPALRYADYDGDGDAYSCDQFPAPCGTLIPGQRE